MSRNPFGIALLIVAMAGDLRPAEAQRSLEIRRFDARIAVAPDASIDVTERIEANFVGSWNGIYRKVPLQYRTPQGFNWSIRVSLISATDDRGTPLRTETSREGHSIQFKMWVPGATDTEKTVMIGNITMPASTRGTTRYATGS